MSVCVCGGGGGDAANIQFVETCEISSGDTPAIPPGAQIGIIIGAYIGDVACTLFFKSL